MPELERKLAALSKVADLLNRNHIIWAVGGSFLLYASKIVDDFADIDIMTRESEIEAVKALLDGQGTRLPANPSAWYASKAFLEYRIDGVDFDVIAGFTILSDGKAHVFPLEREKIQGSVVVQNVSVPLHSLEEWKKYYRLMGKEDKVKRIENAAIATEHNANHE